MSVSATAAPPERSNTHIKSYDYVVIDRKSYALVAMMENGDVIRLHQPTTSPDRAALMNPRAVSVIDLKLSALTSTGMLRSNDLMPILFNYVGMTIDTNRQQYMQLRVFADSIESYEAHNNANA